MQVLNELVGGKKPNDQKRNREGHFHTSLSGDKETEAQSREIFSQVNNKIDKRYASFQS